MQRPCLRLSRRLLVLLLAPPLVWTLILNLLPTEWARARIEARLRAATRHDAHVGSVRLGWLGGVQVADVSISEPGSAAGPWFWARRLRLNLSLLHMLVGLSEPTHVKVDGLALRVHRDQQGNLEFGNLFQGPRRAPTQRSDPDDNRESCPLEIQVRNGRVTILDEPSDTRLEFTSVEAEGTWQERTAELKSLRADLNGGRFAVVAQVDHANDPPMFEGEIRTRGVALKNSMGALRYLVPVVASTSGGSLDGRLDLNLYLRGQGSTRAEIRRAVVGHGSISIDPIRLDGSELVAALADLLELPEHDRIGSVSSQFRVAQGRIATDHLTLAIGHMPIVLAGWTDFDGRVDYQLRQDGLLSRIPQKARTFLADLPVDLNELLTLHVSGTLDNLTLATDSALTDPSSTRHADERMRMREFGRHLRDRILK